MKKYLVIVLLCVSSPAYSQWQSIFRIARYSAVAAHSAGASWHRNNAPQINYHPLPQFIYRPALDGTGLASLRTLPGSITNAVDFYTGNQFTPRDIQGMSPGAGLHPPSTLYSNLPSSYSPAGRLTGFSSTLNLIIWRGAKVEAGLGVTFRMPTRAQQFIDASPYTLESMSASRDLRLAEATEGATLPLPAADFDRLRVTSTWHTKLEFIDMDYTCD